MSEVAKKCLIEWCDFCCSGEHQSSPISIEVEPGHMLVTHAEAYDGAGAGVAINLYLPDGGVWAYGVTPADAREFAKGLLLAAAMAESVPVSA